MKEALVRLYRKDKMLKDHQLLVFKVRSLRVPNQEKDIEEANYH